jgi:hypothetical protein
LSSAIAIASALLGRSCVRPAALRPSGTIVSMLLVVFGMKLRVSAVSARTTGCIFTGSDKSPVVGGQATNADRRRVPAAMSWLPAPERPDPRRETFAQIVANATMPRLMRFTVFLCEHERLVDRKRWSIILPFVAADAPASRIGRTLKIAVRSPRAGAGAHSRGSSWRDGSRPQKKVVGRAMVCSPRKQRMVAVPAWVLVSSPDSWTPQVFRTARGVATRSSWQPQISLAMLRVSLLNEFIAIVFDSTVD